MDLFEKLATRTDHALARMAHEIHGVAAFPKLAGEVGRHMGYGGRRHLVWSLNNYLGLANHPEVRAADAELAARYGLATPMGSRMLTGETDDLEELEAELADYARKPAAAFMNFGYQGMVSLIDALLTRHDWVVYDAQSHACIIDGVRLHRGHAKAFPHNNMERLEATLARVQRLRQPGESVLVISEGVFGMSGVQGKLAEIVALKQRYDFRLLVDDAHGFGVLGPNGGGTGEAQGVQDGIDLYFATFAKAGASIGAFVASEEHVIWQLRYAMRSQIYAKGLPWPVVAGNRVRLRLMRTRPELRQRCWEITLSLQAALRDRGLDIGETASAITPVFMPMDPMRCLDLVKLLRERHSVFCSGVTYPVVPLGVVQLRLIATAEHELEDVALTVDAIVDAHKEVTGGEPLPMHSAERMLS